MSGLKHFLAAFLLSVSPLAAGAARAMPIQQFDKMAGPDQDGYIAELIQGAETVLANGGQAGQSAQVSTLFRTNIAGDKVSVGMTEFYRNLALARAADVKRVATDPGARRIEVEDALAVTLKKNGVALPQAFFTMGKDFRPKLGMH